MTAFKISWLLLLNWVVGLMTVSVIQVPTNEASGRTRDQQASQPPNASPKHWAR
jgi:hypothetical protein